MEAILSNIHEMNFFLPDAPSGFGEALNVKKGNFILLEMQGRSHSVRPLCVIAVLKARHLRRHFTGTAMEGMALCPSL